MVEKTDDVTNHLHRVGRRIVWFATRAMATEVQANDSVTSFQECLGHSGRSPVPLVVRRQPVDEYHGLALALVDVVDLDAVGVEELTILGQIRPRPPQ